MGPSQFFQMSLFFAALSGLGACDTQKKGAEESAPPKTVPQPVQPSAPEIPLPWYEGSFRGAAQVSALSDVTSRDAAEREGREQSDTGGGVVQLKLDLALVSSQATGRGQLGTEEFSVSGTFDQESLRLTFSGVSVRGSWVGKGEEQAARFEGRVRLAKTVTEEGRVSAQPYAGSLVLEKSE